MAPRSATAAFALLLACTLAGCDRPAAPEHDSASTSADPAPATEAPPGVPPAAPALQVTTLDGATWNLKQHRGRWVLLNFWATWCAPCRKEMPELSALDAMNEHIEVLGLAYEDIDPAALRGFLAEHPVVYPVAIVDTFAPLPGFETPRGLPMSYLIAPDGRIAKQVLGPVTAHEIEAAIAEAGGPAPVSAPGAADAPAPAAAPPDSAPAA